MTQFVEVRFHGGKTQRFFGAQKEAKDRGYPDVPTYLRATGQINQWCEVVPIEEIQQFEKAEQARRIIKAKL